MFNFKVWAFLLFVWLLIAKIVATASIAKLGCPSKCGHVNVPYPFGFNPDGSGSCSMNHLYTVICNTSFNPPKPFLPTPSGPIEIIHIDQTWLRIKYNSISTQCFDKGKLTTNITGPILNLTTTPFVISNTKNMFTAVGCADAGMFTGFGENDPASGCITWCVKNQTISGPCSGVGCCQIAIPDKMKSFYAFTIGLQNYTTIGSFNPCGYSFLTEIGKFVFHAADLSNPEFMNRTRDNIPTVLDWMVGVNQTCQQAKKNGSSYACQQNTKCSDFDTRSGGYRCSCLQGYQGNPYLSPGCTDIDECASPSSPCSMPNICTNIPGSFKCSCPEGYNGDGYRNGTGCTSNNSTLSTKLGLGMGLGFLFVLMFMSWLYFTIKRRKLTKLREKFFVQNGGILLKQKLSPNGESMDSSKIFTMDELRVATNDYSEAQILGKGGYGTVYRGILKDGQEVAIKKSRVAEQSQIEQFINEVVILTQINHRNVVKLLGCCLETEVPVLVYEFISNGNLSEHIYGKNNGSWLTWVNCVKLATETANALAYLHSAASIPIIHRDVKSANILLNDFYTAKISDFGASRLIPIDQTQVTTLVQGTLGYLDPEYFFTSQLTEKSDVYSFGIVLAELMTKERPLSFERNMEARNLATYFVSAMEENRLFEIIDPQLIREARKEQLLVMAKLIQKCLYIKGKDRPTMKEVAGELEGLKKQMNHPWVKHDNEGIISLIAQP